MFIVNQVVQGNGGAVSMECSIENTQKCHFVIYNNQFSQNEVSGIGGAIYYDLFSPLGLKYNNTYSLNRALYGNDYGSYPHQLRLLENNTNNNFIFVSGDQQEQIKQIITIGLFDQEEQLINYDSLSEGILYSKDINIQISGNNKLIAKGGIFEFSDLRFIGKPDYMTNISFSSNAIDQRKHKVIHGKEAQDLTLNIYFRSCLPGEVIQNNICVKCPKGFFSYNPKSIQCQRCFDNANCAGGNTTNIKPGFWRSSTTSTKVYQCPKQEACLGGIDSKCADGYSGRMCNKCERYAANGKVYGRNGAYTCQVCPDLGIQIVQILATFIGICLYIMFLLQNVLNNPTRNKPQTVLIRILTNYFQAIMIVKEFDLAWPTQVTKTLNTFSFITNSQEVVLSVDCFLYRSGININFDVFPTIYIKTLLFSATPLLVGSSAALVWFCIHYGVRKLSQRDTQVKTNIIVTYYIITFITYPMISTATFSLFNCFEMDDGKSYLRRDFQIECWTSTHSKMALSIALPLILIWVIAFPAFIYYRLRSNQKNLNDKQLLINYGFFYVGLNDEAYFWEVLVSNARKITFISCSTFFSMSQTQVKALIGIFVLFIQINMIQRVQPYIDPRFNTIDYHSQLSAISTLFCGLFFVQSEVQKNNNLMFLLFLLVLGYNLYFLVLWATRFMTVIFRVHFQKLKRFQVCNWLNHIQIKTYDEDLIEVVIEKQLQQQRLTSDVQTSKNEAGTPMYFQSNRGIIESSSSSFHNAMNAISLNARDSAQLRSSLKKQQQQNRQKIKQSKRLQKKLTIADQPENLIKSKQRRKSQKNSGQETRYGVSLERTNIFIGSPRIKEQRSVTAKSGNNLSPIEDFEERYEHSLRNQEQKQVFSGDKQVFQGISPFARHKKKKMQQDKMFNRYQEKNQLDHVQEVDSQSDE